MEFCSYFHGQQNPAAHPRHKLDDARPVQFGNLLGRIIEGTDTYKFSSHKQLSLSSKGIRMGNSVVVCLAAERNRYQQKGIRGNEIER